MQKGVQNPKALEMLLKTNNGRNTQQHLEEGWRLSFMWAPRKQMKVSQILWKKPETYDNSSLFCANLSS